jgi:S1-C subfamily serine protease
MHGMSLIHLSGPRRGEADLVKDLPANIGSELGSAILVPGVAPLHAQIVSKGLDLVIHDMGSEEGTFLAGEPVRAALLRDGDIVELGRGGPKLRFRSEGEEHVPLLQALEWARPEGAPKGLEDTTNFLRTLAREAEARTSRVFRLTLSLLLLVAVLLLSWSYVLSRRLQRQLAVVQESLRRSEQERQAFQARIEDERRRAGADRRTLRAKEAEFREQQEKLQKQLAAATSGEVETLRSELGLARGRLEALEKENAVGERIIRDYGAGVCLIQVAYAFYDAAGKPLRLRADDSGEPIPGPDGSIQVTVEGTGPLHTVEVLGTGFLVDRRGLIVTNRHVGEPWWKDDTATSLVEKGFHPRIVFMRAFFPKLDGAVDLKVERHAEDSDLSLLKADFHGKKAVPALPLDLTGRGAVAGKPVVVVGYPTGLEAILAKADGTLVQSLLEKAGTRADQLAEALSKKGLIRPSTTQGHIGDVTKTDIVFDAPTTQGGSGGPIFNQEGLVIAVEYAVLPKFGGNAFGIPVRNVLNLLQGPKPDQPIRVAR